MAGCYEHSDELPGSIKALFVYLFIYFFFILFYFILFYFFFLILNDWGTVRPLAHTPAFCRSRIRLRSWGFSHVPALPLPAVFQRD